MAVAKQVSQETFDNVVKENMQEFDMSAEEAVNDATQQFESQGVNLVMIIRDPDLYSEDGSKKEDPVIGAINALSISVDKEVEPVTDDSIKYLNKIKEECDIDLTKRCFAGKNNAYPVLVKSLTVYMDNTEMLIKCLQTMCSLCNGQPDLLDEEGATVMMKIMKEKNEVSVIELIVKLVRLNCTKHEINRREFVQQGLIKELVRVLVANRAYLAIVKEVSYGLRVLTLDDDIRVPFGAAHENAKQIVNECDALRWLLEICKDYPEDIGVQGEVFSTLSKLVVRDEFCSQVKDLGGLDLIMKSFQTNIKHKGIVNQALGLLKALGGNDDIKKAIVKDGGIQLILSAMIHHQGIATISSSGCLALATLVLRQPEHCNIVIQSNGHHVILQAMNIHTQDESVQKNACMAVRNIVARTRELCEPFTELDAEELINEARKFPQCDDEAKAALRDLGCKVDLKERWTGVKGCLTQD